MTNSFITLLDKIGSAFKLGITKALAIEVKALPLENAIAGGIALVDPPLGATLLGLFGVIGKVEQVTVAVGVSKGTGQQKLATALPEIEQIILNEPIFAGKTPANLPLWNTAVESITGALADLLNSYAATPIPVPVTNPLPSPTTSQTKVGQSTITVETVK